MIVKKYHIVYQEGTEFVLNTPFEWLDGPVIYDEGFERVKDLNRIWQGKRVFLLAIENINMKLA